MSRGMIKKLHFLMSDDKGDYGGGSVPPLEVLAAVPAVAAYRPSSGSWGTILSRRPTRFPNALRVRT